MSAHRIVVDVDVLANDNKTGVYYYIQRLLDAVLRLDQDNDYTLVHFGAPAHGGELGLPAGTRVARRVSRFPRMLHTLLLRTPFAPPFDVVTGTRGDLFVFTKFVRYPLWRRSRSMVFVYDTTFVDYPEVIENWHFRAYLRWAVPRSVRRAGRIVAISEATKRSLVSHYGADPDKIAVVTPGLDHSVFKPAPRERIDEVTAGFGIDKPYILSVGTLEPRKNLVGLLRAFELLPPEISEKYALVLAGGKGWLDGEINESYERLSKRLTIVRTGYVPTEDLPALYSGASAFVFPSLFEGFGMPPLEAMACGAPVITADNSSLPEVVGDAGVLVDARDPAGLAREIDRLLTDPVRAEELRTRGIERAREFTWERSARALLQVIG